MPSTTPPSLLAQVRQLIDDVFTHGYVTALRPTLAVSVAVLLAGAVLCLLLRRRPVPLQDPVPAEPVKAAAE